MSDDAVAATLPTHPVSLTPSEITGLVGLFQTMLDRMEGRVIDRMEDNSKRATVRWTKHDDDQSEDRRRIDARLEAVEQSVREHHQLAHDRQLISDSRIKPLKYSVAWLWGNRRDIIILLIGLGVFATFFVEAFGRVIGPHP